MNIQIQGVCETHIAVTDIQASAHFYRDLLGLTVAHERYDENPIVFFWVGGAANTMLGIHERPAEEVLRTHLAFRVSIDDMRKVKDFLLEKGIKPRNNLRNETDDPTVFGWIPAVALFFEDPDGHLLEFIAYLPDDPRPEVGVVTWGEWDTIVNEGI